MDKQIGLITSQLFEEPGLSQHPLVLQTAQAMDYKKMGKKKMRGSGKVGEQHKGTKGCLSTRQESMCGSGPWAPQKKCGRNLPKAVALGEVEGNSRRLQIQSLASSVSFPLACLGWKQGI